MTISLSGGAENLSGILAGAFPEYRYQIISPEQIRIESTGPIHLGRLVRFIEEQQVEVTEARRIIPTLEDVFVSVTGIEAHILKKEAEKKGSAA